MICYYYTVQNYSTRVNDGRGYNDLLYALYIYHNTRVNMADVIIIWYYIYIPVYSPNNTSVNHGRGYNDL